MRKLIAKVTKEGPAAKDPRKPACCVTVHRESVAKAILKKPKPAKAKHGVAKASRKGPRKQVYRTAFYTRVFGTALVDSALCQLVFLGAGFPFKLNQPKKDALFSHGRWASEIE